MQTLAHSTKHPAVAVCFRVRLSPNNNEREQNKTAHWGASDCQYKKTFI